MPRNTIAYNFCRAGYWTAGTIATILMFGFGGGGDPIQTTKIILPPDLPSPWYESPWLLTTIPPLLIMFAAGWIRRRRKS